MSEPQWNLLISPTVRKQLKKFDKPVTERILQGLRRLRDLEDPHTSCKALTGEFSGLWRYRVGDYRIILDINNDQLVIVAVSAGHRSSIYRYLR